jgi:hypothetical protein
LRILSEFEVEEGPVVHLIGQPQIKVDVVRCRGWQDDKPPTVEFILLEEQLGDEDSAASYLAKYEVLDRQSSELPGDSRDVLMETPNLLFNIPVSQRGGAEGEEEACGGEIFLTLVSASHLPTPTPPASGDPFCVLRCQV